MTTEKDNQKPATLPIDRHCHLPSDENNALIAEVVANVTTLVHTLSTGDYFGSAAPLAALAAIVVAQWRNHQKTPTRPPHGDTVADAVCGDIGGLMWC